MNAVWRHRSQGDPWGSHGCLTGGTLKLCAKVTCWEMAMALRRLEGTTSPMWVWSLWRSNGQVPWCGDMLSSIEPCFVLANEIAWCFMGFHGSVLFFGFVCTLFAHFCGVPFLWSFRSEVKLSRLSHRVMKSHYFKHAEQQANWLHLSARNADALEQERTIAICNPTSLYPLCQKSYKAIVVLPVHVTEEIRPQHGIAEELWFHQRKQSEKTPDFCSMEIASADVPWPELAALSGAWKDKNIMRSMMRSWWEIII